MILDSSRKLLLLQFHNLILIFDTFVLVFKSICNSDLEDILRVLGVEILKIFELVESLNNEFYELLPQTDLFWFGLRGRANS